MDSVYLLQHSHSPTPDNEEVKVIGVYRTRDDAVAAVARLQSKAGFINHPKIVDPDVEGSDEGFHISEMVLGRDGWTEGFITWAEALEEK
jgi:hypothetical protein